MNILIVDDHPLVRDGTANLLKQAFTNVNQIFEASNCQEAIEIARKKPLNLVLLDIGFTHGGCEGMAALVELKNEFNSLCVVIHSGYDDNKEWVFDALQKGAMGFLPKNLSREDFIKALKSILNDGRPYLPASVLGYSKLSASAYSIHESSNILEKITPRQLDVLRWVVHGCCNKTIAKKLDIEEQTVKNHLRPLFDLFGVTTRVELIVAVFNRKNIVLGSPEISNTRIK